MDQGRSHYLKGGSIPPTSIYSSAMGGDENWAAVRNL